MSNIPTIDMARTGDNIKRLRIAAGLTVNNLCDILGVSPQAVSKWQLGASVPAVDTLVVLAALFGVRIDDIIAIS